MGDKRESCQHGELYRSRRKRKLCHGYHPRGADKESCAHMKIMSWKCHDIGVWAPKEDIKTEDRVTSSTSTIDYASVDSISVIIKSRKHGHPHSPRAIPRTWETIPQRKSERRQTKMGQSPTKRSQKKG